MASVSEKPDESKSGELIGELSELEKNCATSKPKEGNCLDAKVELFASVTGSTEVSTNKSGSTSSEEKPNCNNLENSIFQCKMCEYCSDSQSKWMHHQFVHTGVKYYKRNMELDDICNVNSSLQKPVRIRSKEKPYKCKVCQYSCRTRLALKEHVEGVHNGRRMYKCDECELRYIRKAHLKCHMNTHIGLKPYKCDECDYRCAEKSHLKRHMNTHTGLKPYKCNDCDYRFATKTNLKYHVNTHIGLKPYKCVECDYRCAAKMNLNKHTNRCHIGLKPHRCDQCQFASFTKAELTRHLRIHTGEKPYKCDYCEHSSASLSNLKKHVIVHTGEKPHKCSSCQHASNSALNLRTHMLTHYKHDKRYKCQECNYASNHLSALKIHLQKHAVDAKPFLCDQCTYVCTSRLQLSLHNRRVHTAGSDAAKPYKCEVCGYRCAAAGHLRRHKDTHSSFKHKCNTCDRAYSQKYTLKKHVLAKHGGLRTGRDAATEINQEDKMTPNYDFYVKMQDLVNKHCLKKVKIELRRCDTAAILAVEGE